MKQALANCIRQYIAVDNEQLEDMLAQYHSLPLAKGEYWVKAGQICTQMCFVNDGLLRTWYEVDGQDITHWISDEGYFDTSLKSFIYDAPSRWNLQALTDCELLVIDKTRHEYLMKTYPQWVVFENHALIQAYLGIEDRMFAHLYMTAEERYEKLLTERPTLMQRTPQQYIASFLGIKPETLSRLRKKQASNIS
jgi:CRP-like cAMP-binding protein